MTNLAEPRFEEIRPRTKRVGRVLAHHAQLSSTMDEARRWAAEGAPDGAVVVADAQSAGRGRDGRTWVSPKGNLHATVILRSGVDGPLAGWVPLLAGVAMAEACERLGRVAARVKWPNDVLVGGRKVAGLLVEATWEGDALALVLVGSGVNCNRDPGGDVRLPATTLAKEMGSHVCQPALLKIYLERLESALRVLDGGVEAAVAFVSPWMDTLGRRVRVVQQGGAVVGVAEGLGPRGELVLESEGRQVFVAAGDCEHVDVVSPDAQQLQNAG